MTQESTVNRRWQVIATFLAKASVHAAVSSFPFAVASLISLFAPESSLGKLAYTWAAGFVVVIGAVGYSAFGQYKEVVMPFFDLSEVPVELARHQVRLCFRYLWPRTILVGACVLGCVALLRQPSHSSDATSTGGNQFAWGMLCVVGAAGSFRLGNWLQKTLLHIYGPSAQAKYAKMAEAMDAGARAAVADTSTSTTEESKLPLPFDRPPV